MRITKVGIPSGGTTSQVLVKNSNTDYDVTWGAGGGGGGITGSGTSGYITFWNGSSTVTGESALFWDSTNDRLGISSTASFGKVSVGSGTGFVGFNVGTSSSPERGNIFFDTDGTGWKMNIGKYQSSSFSPIMTIHDSSNVSIGTTTDSGFKFDVNGTTRIQDNITISDTKNIILGTTTGTKIGTATTQKLGFFNATPVVQPSAVTSPQGIADALTSLGLLASSTISGGGSDVGSKLYLFNAY
jgi:hypothetical protein